VSVELDTLKTLCAYHYGRAGAVLGYVQNLLVREFCVRVYGMLVGARQYHGVCVSACVGGWAATSTMCAAVFMRPPAFFGDLFLHFCFCIYAYIICVHGKSAYLFVSVYLYIVYIHTRISVCIS
jgi:hypothetical protein